MGLLVLHKKDLADLVEEFPQFAWVWRTAARRRELHRRILLMKFNVGRSLKAFAASIIQRIVRKRNKRLASVKPSYRKTVSTTTLSAFTEIAPGMGRMQFDGPQYAQVLKTDVDALKRDMAQVQSTLDGLRGDIAQLVHAKVASSSDAP